MSIERSRINRRRIIGHAMQSRASKETVQGSNHIKIEAHKAYLKDVKANINSIYSYEEGRVLSHEVGHTGYLHHSSGAIMKEDVGDGSPAPTYSQRKLIFKGRQKIKN